MKKLLSTFISGVMAVSSVSVLAGSAKEPDNSLWNKFLKYDLCITDYSSLDDTEKELAHFIFDTEQSSDDAIWCQRARLYLRYCLNGYITYLNSERITIDQLLDARGIEPDCFHSDALTTGFISCTPDIIHLDEWVGRDPLLQYEYWLTDSGNTYITIDNKYNSKDYQFVLSDREDGALWKFDAQSNEDMRNAMKGDDDAKRAAGFIEKNGGWYYKAPTNAVTFMGFVEPFAEDAEKIDETFTIEPLVDGSQVTAIATHALQNAPYTEIALPDCISSIGAEAFLNCKYLKKIELGNHVHNIGYGAFACCDSLEEIVVDCPYLRSCTRAFTLLPNLKKAYVNVPEIGQMAFSYASSLEDLTFGPAVKKICADAFEGCRSLTEISLPDQLHAIGSGAFEGTALRSVTIEPFVEVLGALPISRGAYYGGLSTDPVSNLDMELDCVFPEDCKLVGYRGTEADRYAQEWGLAFDEIGTDAGDVNIDGKVNMSDAVSLQKYLLGRYVPTGAYYGDMTGEGNVNVYDMIALKDEIVK